MTRGRGPTLPATKSQRFSLSTITTTTITIIIIGIIITTITIITGGTGTIIDGAVSRGRARSFDPKRGEV